MMSAVVTNVLVLVGALLLETTLIDADSNDCIIYDVLAENTHVTHDGETILKCMSLCNEEPIIKWYVGKEEKQSKKGTAEGFRDAKIYEQNLTATMLNKGTEFICSVECGTELLNETITVYVGDPPMIETVIPPVQRIFKGRDTNIECKGHSKEYTRVIWMKDGYKIPPVKTNYQSGTFTSLLQVINVTHDVVYTCKAHNIYGITERTAEIRLGQPPVILEMKTNSSLPILTGESVMVTCLIQFDGNISVMWLEDKEEVSTTEDSVDTLTEKEFHFTYDSVLKTFNASCHAINTFGTITKSLELETSCDEVEDRTKGGNKNTLRIALGISIAIVAVCLLIGIVILCLKKRANKPKPI